MGCAPKHRRKLVVRGSLNEAPQMTEPLETFEQNGGNKKPFWDNQSGRGYKSPYEMWKEQEGLPTLHGWGVDNLYTLELHPWETRGGSGIFINLEGSEGFTDSYVCEIPPAWRHKGTPSS